MELAKETIRKYVASGGTFCPFCKGNNIEGQDLDFEGGVILQRVVCLDCGKEWKDCYRLSGISQEEL
jgi:transposase-like protein